MTRVSTTVGCSVVPLVVGVVGVVGIAGIGGGAGCAPMHTRTSTFEEVTGRRTVTDPPRTRADAAAVDVLDGGARLSIVLVDRGTCDRYEVKDVRRQEQRVRKPSGFFVWSEYVLGLGLAGAGGYTAYDPEGVHAWAIEGDDSVTVEHTEIGGYVIAGLGGVVLLSAVIDSASGGTTVRELGPVVRKVGKTKEVACDDRPRSGVTIALVAGKRAVPLGTSDAKGRLEVAWAALPADFDFLEGSEWPRGGLLVVVVGGDVAQVERDLQAGKAPAGARLGEVDLAPARNVLATRAWQEADKAGTLAALRGFRVRFPDVRADEVEARVRAAANLELDAAVAAALASGDIDAAKAALTDWRALDPGSAKLAAREPEVAELEKKGRAGMLWQRFDEALAAVTASELEVDALGRAEALLGEIGRVAAQDPRLAAGHEQLAATRRVKLDLLLGLARKADKQKDLRRALELGLLAERAAPGDPAAAKFVATAQRKLAHTLAENARALARKGELDAAEAALGEAEKLAPGDKVVASARGRVAARRAKAAADAQRAEAQLAAKQRAQEERQAALDAQHRSKEEREAARVERQRALEEQRKADEQAALDARRAADEQRKADEQAALDAAQRKADEKRMTDEQRKLEAQRKVDEQRTADEQRKLEAQRKADEQRAADEQRKLDAQRKVDEKRAADEQRKLDAQRRADARKPPDPRRTPPAQPPATPAPRPATATGPYVGGWVTAMHDGAGRPAGGMLLWMGADGTGQLSLVDARNQVIGRKAVTWRVERGSLEVLPATGGRLWGAARFEGGKLVWAGGVWARVPR